MRRIVFLVVAAHALALNCRLLAGDTPDSADEFAKVKSEYADVLALEGTAKGEILAIAKILRAKPRIAVDQTAATGEYNGSFCHPTGRHSRRRCLRVRRLRPYCGRLGPVAVAAIT